MRWVALALFLPAAAAVAAENDLSVGWISRNPKVDYVWESTNPRVEGWPEPGADVQWVANVRWLGAAPVENVGYRWLLDGAVVAKGTLDFEPASLVQTSLPWKWTFERHEVVFEIDDAGRVAETEERNNRLLVHTNALGIGFYVERRFWDAMSAKVKGVAIGATTFDNWTQILVRHFNEMAQYSVYDDAPLGVLDRWRIDEIHLLDDGSLPLAPPYTEARDWGANAQSQAVLFPNVRDHTVDMQWGFPAFAAEYYPFTTPWILTIGTSLLHELAHARTMIDTYAWNVGVDDDYVGVNPRPRATGNYFYMSREHGLMHFDWGHIDRFTAVMMNVMAGQRARRGNYNEPWDLGWFLNDFPAANRVRFVRPDGSAIANSEIRVFCPLPDLIGKIPYSMHYKPDPDLTLRTDASGAVDVPRNIISDEEITAFVERTNGTSIVEIRDGATTRWAYLESLQFNLAYWKGNREFAEYTVMADAPVCRDSLGPSRVTPYPEAVVTSADVAFTFPVTANRTYDFHYAVDHGAPVTVRVGPFGDSNGAVTLPLPQGHVNWWFVDPNTAPCPPARSSVYAFDHIVTPRRRAATR